MDIHETPASYRVVSASHSLHKMPFSQVVCIIWQALISVFSFLNPPEKLANSFLDGLLYFDNLKLLLMAMPAYGSPKSILAAVFSNWSAQLDRNGRHIRLSKERQNKLAWTSTDPKHTHFVWDGTRLLQEYTYKGHYTYICANQDSCEPLAPVHNRTNAENENRQQTYYFHCDQISIPKEMTGIHGNLLWYGGYTA